MNKIFKKRKENDQKLEDVEYIFFVKKRQIHFNIYISSNT